MKRWTKLLMVPMVALGFAVAPASPAAANETAAPGGGCDGAADVEVCASASVSSDDPAHPDADASGYQGTRGVRASTNHHGAVTEVTGVCVGLGTLDPAACVNGGRIWTERDGSVHTQRCFVEVHLTGTHVCNEPTSG